MVVMTTSFKRTYASMYCGSQDCCSLCLWPCGRPLSTHISTRYSCTLTGKSGSVSCGVRAPFSWILVETSFVCSLQESVSWILWKFCNQIPLASKVKVPEGSQSLCRTPRLGSVFWVIELSYQYENFFGIILLQFLGCLLGDSMVGNAAWPRSHYPYPRALLWRLESTAGVLDRWPWSFQEREVSVFPK